MSIFSIAAITSRKNEQTSKIVNIDPLIVVRFKGSQSYSKCVMKPLNSFRSVCGQDGKSKVVLDQDLTIEFRATDNRDVHWRTDVSEGQLPYFLLWPL